MDILRISPDVILARERSRRFRLIFLILAAAVVLLTVLLLINPATTMEYAPVCGMEEHTHDESCYSIQFEELCPLEACEPHVHTEDCYEKVRVTVCGLDGDPEHEHTDECWAEETKLVCELPENVIHVHTAECVEWRKVTVCGLDDDPEHEHTEACYEEIEVFTCLEDPKLTGPGVGHVHNEFCTLRHEVLTCGLPEHTHTDPCYPELTGDPHADVDTQLDWESTMCTVKLTGNWAEDLVAIAMTQIGYEESQDNFVTDAYNVRHGYTRYGDWYGDRYESWNGLFVMFCLRYAGTYPVYGDPSPARWMQAAAENGLFFEADGERPVPIPVEPETEAESDEIAEEAEAELFLEAETGPRPGDIAFFDDDGDGLADTVGIVQAVFDGGAEIDVILGTADKGVHLETVRAERAEPEFTEVEAEAEATDEADESAEFGVFADTLRTARLGRTILGYLALPENPNPEPELPEEELPAEGTFDTVKAPEDPEEILDPEVPLAPPTDILLTAQTPDGITAVLEAPASSFAYPAAELELSIREIVPEAEEDGEAYGTAMDVIDTLSVAEDPEAELGAVRLFDISVWRREIVSPEPVETPEPDEAVEVTEEPVEQAEPAADEISEETEADPELDSEPEAAEEEILPEAEPEIRLTEILPIGPVRVTVEGLEEVGEDESVRVWHITEDGDAEVLTPESFGHGIVSVTTENF